MMQSIIICSALGAIKGVSISVLTVPRTQAPAGVMTLQVHQNHLGSFLKLPGSRLQPEPQVSASFQSPPGDSN